MSGSGRADHTSREIARGLAEVLENALAPGAPVLAISAGREVALLLELVGLERVLALAEVHGAHRPAALEYVLDRVRRLNTTVRETESVAALQDADAELGAHAATLAAQEWSEPTPGRISSPVATISLVDALPGWALRGVDPLAPPIVTAPVAAALSAACDWLGLEPSRGMDAELHDDFVALIFDVHQPEGLAATGDVLGTVGGHLAPVGAGSRRWRLVVPRSVQRPSFLLIEQGRLGLAVPWHSVLKLRMLSPERAGDEAAVLPPLRWATHGAGERPAALLAHGLKRAWFFADRVVWRFAADTEETDAVPPVAGLSLAVRGDENTLYWVVDPAWLLRATPVAVPEWREAPGPIAEATDSEPGAALEPEPAPEPEPDFADADAVPEFTSPEPVRVLPEQPVEHATTSGPADSADAAFDRLFLTPSDEASEPAAAEEWADEADDDGVEWLVTEGSGEASKAGASRAPTLTLLTSDDVEPLSDQALLPAPSRVARAMELHIEVEATAEPATEATAQPATETTAESASVEVPAPEVEERAPIEEPAPDKGTAPFATPAPAQESMSIEAPTPVGALLPMEAPASVERLAPAEAPSPVEVPTSIAGTTPIEPEGPGEPLVPLEITSRLALVAEDSLVASIFLQRLLEQRGFRAVSVEMAHDLSHELQRGGWGLLCVDVHLPDAAGIAHLEAAVRAGREAASGVAVIALTRDGDDERLALGAGVVHHLRKPFEAGAMDKLFVTLGLAKRGGRS